jgi:hypothetical protein
VLILARVATPDLRDRLYTAPADLARAGKLAFFFGLLGALSSFCAAL